MPINDSSIAATALALGVPVVTQDDDYPELDDLAVATGLTHPLPMSRSLQGVDRARWFFAGMKLDLVLGTLRGTFVTYDRPQRGDVVDQSTIESIEGLLRSHSESLGYGDPEFINAGASAAVFRVRASDGERAIKVFDPQFLKGVGGESERRRLELQRNLIGHDCRYLVQTIRVDEALGTAFVEMEYVDWPRLTSQLSDVPDEAVQPLIEQLVEVVTFLEDRQLVHRDIKPDNIHVAPDFSELKLLDLGVAREFVLDEALEAAGTDQDQRRPFLATAQYSSPEYLFRLDEPTERLWLGLNLYQVGAVLHDLIMRKPIFSEEVATGNKYVVARAVLLKPPWFDDGDARRLTALKALSARCLTKDLDTRLRTVAWDDFRTTVPADPVAALDQALDRTTRETGAGRGAVTANFRRTEFIRRISERIRSEIVSAAGPRLPSVLELGPGEPTRFRLSFDYQPGIRIVFDTHCEWLGGLYADTAHLLVSSFIACSEDASLTPCRLHVCSVTIEEDEGSVAEFVTATIATALTTAIDQIAVTTDVGDLHGFDLLGVSSE